jgi:conjugal transfer pilus assembly protein TraB
MNTIIQNISNAFGRLSPEKRRYAMISVGLFVLIAASILAMLLGNTVTKEKKVRSTSKSVEFYPLTGRDTGKLTTDVMSERIKLLEGELEKLKTGEGVPIAPLEPQSTNVTPLKDVAGNAFPIQSGTSDAIFSPGVVPPPVRKNISQADASVKAVEPVISAEPLFPSPTGTKNNNTFSNDSGQDGFPADSGSSRKLEIREIVDENEKKLSEKEQHKNLNQENGLFMPAGSIISGVLITGMDAPTANQSKKDPFPVLLRIKDETLLPNRMKMDIKECFLIASGYGDMSSERAYIRAETVSCVKEDGGVIETGVNAYSVGEDGKNGVRGRLVSKTGSLVAKSLMAGFLGGVADVMKPQKVPTLAVNPAGDNKQNYFNVDPEQVFAQGALGGVNSAMSKIADYYLEMAKQIFPIIEIDPGRKVDFIVIRGAKLSIQGGKNSNGKQNGQPSRGNSRQNQSNQYSNNQQGTY